MLPGKVELLGLVIKAFSYKKLTEKETRKMLKALWGKFQSHGLDSFQERVVLTSYINHPHSKEARDNYIKEALERLSRHA